MKALVSMVICFILSIPVFAFQFKNGDWVKWSREELKSELDKLKGKNDRVKDRVDLRNLLAYKLSSYSHKEAKEYAEEARATSKRIDYTEGLIIDSLNNLGAVYERMGKSEAAKRKQEKALRIAQKANYEIGQAQALIGLVRCNQVRGQFDMAFTLGLKSEYILEKIAPKNPLVNRILAASYHALGVIYFYDRNTFGKARDYFQNSLELGEEVGDKD